MGDKHNLRQRCSDLARILGENVTGMFSNGVCVISALRQDLKVKILGRRTRSPLVIPVLLSFENVDDRGRALSLGETVILQEEINPFISVLRENDIIVTALHNHWLFDEPRLFYLHWEAIMRPERFVEAVAEAFDAIGVDFDSDR